MKDLSLYHASWLVPFRNYLRRRGVDLRGYAAGAGISLGLFESGDGWIPKQQVYQFLNAVADGERMPDLGFAVGDTLTPASLGAIGESMAQARTLAEAIRVFCRLINRHAEENRSSLQEDEDDPSQVWLLNQTTNPFEAKRDIADHAGAMTLTNIVRMTAGRDWYPYRLRIQTEATTAYRKVPGLQGCEVFFNASSTGVAFPAHLLLGCTDEGAQRSQYRPRKADILGQSESTIEKLSRIIRSVYGAGGLVPTLDLMAEFCGTSPRTLQRRIKEAGTSYKGMLSNIRLENAKSQLHFSDLSVKQIAFELGYSASSNFVRAFKLATGTTPTEYRQSVGAATVR